MQCSNNLWHHLPYFLGSLLTLGIADLIINKISGSNARWFKLHVFSNLIISIFSYQDAIAVLLDPLYNSATEEAALIPSNMCLALHIYHTLMFSNLTVIDWIHHIVMMAVLGISFWCPNPAVSNYALFALCGLPGGIDYLLLTLVKYKVIHRITEKRINTKLNIWFRGPWVLIGAYIIYIQWRYAVIHYQLSALSFIIIGMYWNAQYFTERVVYNWGHHSDTSIPPNC